MKVRLRSAAAAVGTLAGGLSLLHVLGPLLSPPSRRPPVRLRPTPTPNRTKSHSVVGCPIAALRVWEPALAGFFHDVPPLECKAEAAWTRPGPQGTFDVDAAAVERHGPINCDYTHFWRDSDHRTLTKTYASFQSGSRLKGDYFKATCSAKDGSKYSNIHATVIPKPEAIARAKANRAKFPNSLDLNVIILGFDSVSRMTFMRKMPKTYEYLTSVLGAVVLKGYNIVGDGTPQAFIPILTAQTEEELPLTRKRYPKANYVDVYPMIWKAFSDAGYVTLYGEDSAAIGTFTYRLKGFKEQPTDHYTRTFYTIAEQEYKNHPKFCFWDEPQHRIFWRYNEEFLTRYPTDVRKFSLMHYSYLTHDDVNTPQLVDADAAAHLRSLSDAGVLDRSLLIVMADHGHRFANLRATQQGQLEERLPFMSLVAPPWFRQRHASAWANLEDNVDVLTSPFDVHATLAALLQWRAPSKLGGKLPRSLSLWDAIPFRRTCEDAGIAAHWCACLTWEPLDVADPSVVSVAGALIQAMNNETEKERRLCAPLGLVRVESARRLVPHQDVLRYKNAKDKDGFVPDLSGKGKVTLAQYQLRIRTRPGNGLFEATMPYELISGSTTVDLNVVSHINKFGDLPHCIIDRNYFLAKYCVCYDRITSDEKGR